MKAILDEPRTFESKSPNAEDAFIDVNTDLQSIVINASAAEVYRRLLHFEDLPRFITSITKIELLSLTRFLCTSLVNDKEITSDVMIMMRVPDRRITWQTVSDQFLIGVIFVDPLLDGTTKLTVKVRSIIEPVMLTGTLRRYLRNFKQFLEGNPSLGIR